MLGERRLRALCIYLFSVAIRDNIQHTQTIMKLAKKRLPFKPLLEGVEISMLLPCRVETRNQFSILVCVMILAFINLIFLSHLFHNITPIQ